MGKAIVYAKQGVLQGVFTNKKNFWDDLMKIEKSPNTLMIKLSPTKTSQLTYQKVVKYLKERGMLKIYKKRELDDYEKFDNIEQCPAHIKVWECESNKHYKLKNTGI